MQGLLQNKQQQPAPQQPQEASAEPSQGSREQYDIAAGQLIQWIASDEGYQAVEQALKTGQPQQAIARIIGRLLTMMSQSAYLAGKKIPPKVLFVAGMDAARAMSVIAQKLGVIDVTNEKEIVENAFFEGVALFGEEASSEALTESDRASYAQLIDQVEQMAAKANSGQPQQSAGVAQQ